MVDVIKRDRKRERFSRAKIHRAVEKAAQQARVSASRRKELAREISEGVHERLSGKRSVRSSELRRMVLSRLERREPSAATAWRRYKKIRR